MASRSVVLVVVCALLGLAGGAVVAVGSVAAAAATRPSTPSTPSTPKAGIASSRYLGDGDPSRLTGIGATWSYDWSATAPARSTRLDWVPMVWGGGSVTQATLAALGTDRRDGRAEDLLGFNEPDNPGQSNMTPGQAAALWPELERTGLRLGSPAVATASDGWLSHFMTLARQRHLRVDFIALHYYQDFTDPDAVAQLRAQLIAIHRAYGRPIWITEIGALDTTQWHEPMRQPATMARAINYLRRLVPMLDGLSFVQRWAWFTDDCWNDAACHSSSLYDGAGRLTALGRVFSQLTR